MRTVPAAIQTLIDSGEVQFAWICKLKRPDGTIHAFCNEHDRALSVDMGDGDGEIIYRPGVITENTEIDISEGTQINSSAIDGAFAELQSFNIDPEDVKKKLYDGAQLSVAVCHWPDPSLGIIFINRQVVGDITVVDSKWTFETRSLISLWDVRCGLKILPECRHVFGSTECGYDLTGQIFDLTITEIVDDRRVKVDNTLEADYFRYGDGEVLTGRNSQFKLKVLSSGQNTADEIEFSNVTPFAFEVGDTVRLKRGCNNTKTDCIKYGQLREFGGFFDVTGSKIRNQRGSNDGKGNNTVRDVANSILFNS